MTPHKKLFAANVLMLVGIIPLLFGIYWVASTFATTDYNRQSEIGDAVMVLGKVMFAYVFAFFVSGAGALWSTRVAKRNAGIRTGVSKGVRIFVCIILAVPLVLGAL